MLFTCSILFITDYSLLHSAPEIPNKTKGYFTFHISCLRILPLSQPLADIPHPKNGILYDFTGGVGCSALSFLTLLNKKTAT